MVNGDDPYNVDERIKNYFQNLGKPDKDDPQYIFGKGAIETAGLQGMARGMAQMGTVHGKSPSAESFVDSSNKSLQGLGTLAKEPVIDPQVMQYLQTKMKHPKGVQGIAYQKGPITPNNTASNYNPQTGEYEDTGFKVRVPPASPGKLPPVDKRALAADEAEANYVQKNNLYTDLMSQYDNAGIFTGPVMGNVGSFMNERGLSVNKDFDALNQNVMSMTNQYIKEITGASASASEMKRLQGNLPRPGQTRALFESKVRGLEKEVQSIVNEKRLAAGLSPIDFNKPISPQLKNRASPLQNLPQKNSSQPASSAPLTPEELEELKRLKSLENGGN